MKIAIIYTNYGPHHLARLKTSQMYLQNIGYEVVGIELAREEMIYAWKTEIRELSGKFITLFTDIPLEKIPRFRLIKKLVLTLKSVNPDYLLIAGYSAPGMSVASIWGRVNNKQNILLSVSKEDDFKRNKLIENLKKLLLKNFDAALVAGKPQKRYLVKLGFPPHKIITGNNVIGNKDFNPNKISQLDSLIQRNYFLAVNRFIPKKNIINLIKGYSHYRQLVGHESWDLVLCGDGEQRNLIESTIAELNLREFVHLPGFLQQNEILPYFAHASCFVHASIQEQWGLVVNEAMAASLPVIVSNACGCFEDLVVEGVNGFGFDPTNQKQLAELMHKVSSPDFDLKAMAQKSYRHIQQFSPEKFAKNIEKVIMHT